MKKIIVFVIVFFITFSISVSAGTIGDIDDNGKINALDYTLLRNYLLGKSNFTSTQKQNADLDGNSKLNSLDYVALRKKILNKETTVTDYIEVYFLNTITNSSMPISEQNKTNEAIIIKASNKYILVDSGINSTAIKNIIYNKLKELQNSNKVTLDYMIVSHLHSDHTGNAVSIIKDDKFIIKNLVLKKESLDSPIIVYNDITNAATERNNKAGNSQKISVIDTNKKFSEGSSYSINSNVKMYFFNVSDVYASDKDICNKTDYALSFNSSVTEIEDIAKATNDKYIYMDGSDYVKNGNKVKIKTTANAESVVDNNNRINNRFYLHFMGKRNPCTSNANSLAIIFQIKTTNGNKYIYLPNDLENAGYNPFGEYDSNQKTTIHGYNPTYFYEYQMNGSEPRFIIKDGSLVKSTKTKSVKKPSSYVTAKNIKSKLSDVVNNIVIYQLSHHGLNNYQEVIDLLKINQKGVYSISPSNRPKTSSQFHTQQSVYNLKNTTIQGVGEKKKNGIKCTVNSIGTTKCIDY